MCGRKDWHATLSPATQGRMMSLAMFVTMGLTPVSTPIAGALVKLNPTVFLLVTGALAAALSLLAALNFLAREKVTILS